MPKVRLWASVWIAAWAVAPPAAGQEPRFTLEFASAAPERFSGVAGDSFGPFEVSAALRPAGLSGPAGPHGWSIAVRHDPLLELLQVTADGTNAGGLLDPRSGFLHIEMIDPGKNGGHPGYVSSAVLSGDRSVFLAPDRLSTIASATYRGVHPAVTEASDVTLAFAFVDGLVGSAQPVVNAVSYGDGSYAPALRPLTRNLRTIPPCNAALSLGLGVPGSVADGDGRRLVVDLPAGQELVIEATAWMGSKLKPGPEGWSISVKHDRPFFRLESATTDGTDVGELATHNPSFLKTEVVDGEGGTGFISAVILSLEEPIELPPSEHFTIARARYRLVAPHDEPGRISAPPLRYEDGLQGENPPVDNIITVEGTTQKACRKVYLAVDVNVVRGGLVFNRGDANNDARVNISDAVWLAHRLFLGAPAPVCLASADFNGDLMVDTSDVVFLLVYLFRSGPSLPAPFLRCAPEPRLNDPLGCNEAAVRCP